MIVVTGANGQLGNAVVKCLLGRVPAGQIAVRVRDMVEAADLARRGVAVRQADVSDEASLRAAFEGAGRVLIVSPLALPT